MAFNYNMSLGKVTFDADHDIWDLVPAEVLSKLCGSENRIGQAGELQLIGCNAPQELSLLRADGPKCLNNN